MGKMLIIRGATYTSPSNPGNNQGNNSGNNNGQEEQNPTPTPTPQEVPYVFYYSSSQGVWHRNRSAITQVYAVAMVFAQPFMDSGITRIDTDMSSLAAPTAVVYFGGDGEAMAGDSWPHPEYYQWASFENLTASMELGERAALNGIIYLAKTVGQPISDADVDAIVASAQTAITLNYD